MRWLQRVRAGRADRRRRAEQWFRALPPVAWVRRHPARRWVDRRLDAAWKREVAKAALGITPVLVVLPLLARDSLLYLPGTDVPPLPAVGLPDTEPLTVETDDGLALDAWFVPADGATVGAVLVLHGNGGDRADRAPLAARLRTMGLASLLLDYRGYGGNPGRPSQDGLLTDAEAGLAALRRHTRLPADRVVVFGESLGAAVAAGVAAAEQPAGLVLRSPFTDIVTVARRRAPWLPVRALLRDHYPTTDWLADYRGPTLVVAGDSDWIIPTEVSRRVAAAGGGDTRLRVIADAGHNSRALLDGDELLTAVAEFLRADVGVPVRDPT